MARILVLQLARMGDLVQSLYLCRDLKEAEGHEVFLLSDSRHLPLVRRIAPWLEAYPLGIERTLKGFRRGDSWVPLGESLSRELRSLRDIRFDRVINLNFGRLSISLASNFLPVERVEGFAAAEGGPHGDRWADLFSRLIQTNRRWNRFHLVDVFRSYAHRRPRPPERQRGPAGRFERGVLGVQLATRSSKRTWPADSFADLVRHLQQESDCEILLLGEARDRELADKVWRATGGRRIRNLVGKTSLTDLADALEACDFVVSGDTGTLHLASWLGVPTLALFFGPACGFETGPYGTGHSLMQVESECFPCQEEAPCQTRACRTSLTATDVFQALTGGAPPEAANLRVYESVFVDRWVQYRPSPRRAATRDDLISYLYWGSVGEFLETAPGRFPSWDTALGFLVSGYRLNGLAAGFEARELDGALPAGLAAEPRARLRSILARNLTRLKEICHAVPAGKPVRAERATTGDCAAA